MLLQLLLLGELGLKKVINILMHFNWKSKYQQRISCMSRVLSSHQVEKILLKNIKNPSKCCLNGRKCWIKNKSDKHDPVSLVLWSTNFHVDFFKQKKTFRWFSYEASLAAVKGFVGELEIDIFSLKTMFALSFLIRYWHWSNKC